MEYGIYLISAQIGGPSWNPLANRNIRSKLSSRYERNIRRFKVKIYESTLAISNIIRYQQEG